MFVSILKQCWLPMALENDIILAFVGVKLLSLTVLHSSLFHPRLSVSPCGAIIFSPIHNIHFHSSKCSPFSPAPLFFLVWYFCPCPPPSLHSVSHPPFVLAPTGTQGASRLPPSDGLRRHHEPSVLPKRRLGPCESLTFILSMFPSLLFTLCCLNHLNNSKWR